MPLEVKPKEDEQTFVSRCIGHYVSKGYPQKQAAAVCYSEYTNRNKNTKKETKK